MRLRVYLLDKCIFSAPKAVLFEPDLNLDLSKKGGRLGRNFVSELE